MNILFIEYKVNGNDEETYVAAMKRELIDVENVAWLESHERKFQYLEVWRFASVDILEQFIYERTKQSDSAWRTFDHYIVGGPEKVKAWSFRVRS